MCSDEILPLSMVSIFRELGFLLKFDIFNLAIPLPDLFFYHVGKDYIRFRQFSMKKIFSDKSLFRMTFDELLLLLFVPRCKIMFVGERFKYSLRKSFMSCVVVHSHICKFISAKV